MVYMITLFPVRLQFGFSQLVAVTVYVNIYNSNC